MTCSDPFARIGRWVCAWLRTPLEPFEGSRAGPIRAAMREAHAALMVTDCPLAAIQIEQGTGTRPLNPAEVLARAYEPDGFPNALEPASSAAVSEKS